MLKAYYLPGLFSSLFLLLLTGPLLTFFCSCLVSVASCRCLATSLERLNALCVTFLFLCKNVCYICIHHFYNQFVPFRSLLAWSLQLDLIITRFYLVIFNGVEVVFLVVLVLPVQFMVLDIGVLGFINTTSEGKYLLEKYFSNFYIFTFQVRSQLSASFVSQHFVCAVVCAYCRDHRRGVWYSDLVIWWGNVLHIPDLVVILLVSFVIFIQFICVCFWSA